MKAIWNNKVIAESNDTVIVENNHYFPPETLNKDYIKESEMHTVCPWKGTASYYTIAVDGKENQDAAWYYPETSPIADKIKGRIAFWRGVEITE